MMEFANNNYFTNSSFQDSFSEKSFLQQSLLFEDSQNSLLPPMDLDYLLDYPTTLNYNDFQLWEECPPLLCEDAWKPRTQIPPLPSFPSTIENSNSLPFEDDSQFTLPNNILNDQSLDTIVAEGLTMPKQGDNNIIKVENAIGDEDINDQNNEEFRKNKATKIESISYEEIRKYFDMPIRTAAQKLNVGLTILKKRCRELNIKRWPHRKIKSLEALINSCKEQGMVKITEQLEDDKRKLQFMPSFELSEETKRLRQQCFKANYKKRRAALAITYV